ncbi:MAG: aspartate-semialdehyde dehydrogenase [candidate division Zixibacteria bacterium]|nr:aspartate-semialdehyde dehydrogenase [candidate division Zixibacteria bacterium]
MPIIKSNKNNIFREPVAILGASGIVGQIFAWLLSTHPWFEPVMFCATSKRKGQQYGKDIPWLLPVEKPESLVESSFEKNDINKLRKRGVKIVFSALPGNVAGEIEDNLRQEGFFIFSNAGAHRMETNTPIIIPEINSYDINQIKPQGFPESGFIICNSNCAVSGLALSIAPLMNLGITGLTVATYQSISGAGYPGIPSLDIAGGILTKINGEENKIPLEINKIFKTDINIFPTCVRVAVPFGHLISVWVDFADKISKKEILQNWGNFGMQSYQLPSLPNQTIVYSDDHRELSPTKSFLGNPSGMQVRIGRLQVENNRARFIVLVNNLVRGAAAGSIANAELFLKTFGN